MIRICLAVALLISVAQAQALEITQGAFGGLSFSKFKTDGSGHDFDISPALEVGYSILLPFSDSFALRTGAGLIGKNSTLDTGALNNGDVDIHLTYLEIPITAYIPLSQVVSGIAGINLDIKLADDCERDFGGSCSLRDDKSLVTSAVGGLRFNLNGPQNLEALLEFGITDMYQDTKLEFGHSLRYVYNF